MKRNQKLLVGYALLWVGLIAFGFAAASIKPTESGIGYTLLVLAGTSGIIIVAVVSISASIIEGQK